MSRPRSIGVVAAVNDDGILADNLERSPIFSVQVPFCPMRGYASAGKAYNTGLDACDAEIVVFVHQDVYLPFPWRQQLLDGIQAIEAVDSRWAVVGVYGVNGNSEHIGHCWSTGLNRVLGAPFGIPKRVVSIDELVIILRKSSGLRFDVDLPGFHLYGTDIVQSALSNGLGAYVIDAPVIHNSRPVRNLRGAYSSAYAYMKAKWKEVLPIPTTVVPLTKYGMPLLRHKLRALLMHAGRNKTAAAVAIPRRNGDVIAKELGFE